MSVSFGKLGSRACIFGAILALGLVFVGCKTVGQQEGAKSWPLQRSEPVGRVGGRSSLRVAPMNFFLVLIIDVPSGSGINESLYSYLDEQLAGGVSWPVLRNNGLRLGVGQIENFAAIKSLLDGAQAKVSSRLQLTVGLMQPIRILSDPVRRQRTLFYYDIAGRPHGRDLTDSSLGIVISASGAGGSEGALVVNLAPEIRYRSVPVRFKMVAGQPRRVFGPDREILNDLAVKFKLDEGEFALLGPSGSNLAESLVGSQLFLDDQTLGGYQRYCLICRQMPEGLGKGLGKSDEQQKQQKQ